MASGKEIIDFAIKTLEEKKEGGIRYSELKKILVKEFNDTKNGTIIGAIHKLGNNEKVFKPAQGLYVFKAYWKDTQNSALCDKTLVTDENEYDEKAFYQPFAEYLQNDEEECKTAIPLGGNVFGGRWRTPDVIGISKGKNTDLIQPTPEVVSAEIKTNKGDISTAFGQACSYKLFSHKVYLVIPKNEEGNSSAAYEKVIGECESICIRLGIGLVLFNSKNPKYPDWEIRVRAIKTEPDYRSVHEYLKKIDEKNLELLFK